MVFANIEYLFLLLLLIPYPLKMTFYCVTDTKNAPT